MQELVEQGYRPCPSCNALLKPDAVWCRFCRHQTASGPPSDTQPGTSESQTRESRPRSPVNRQARRGHLGSLATVPNRVVQLVVTGLPVPQGSVSAPTGGVIRRSDGPKLNAWRNRITAEAFRVCSPQWVAANTGVRVDVVFTVPRPKSAPASTAVPADGYRDWDKLTRAVGDALAPSSADQFHVLASDMRIVGSLIGPEKTHPRPLHTHPLALDEPGVVIRIRPAEDEPIEPIRQPDGQWGWFISCPDPSICPTSSTPVVRGRIP